MKYPLFALLISLFASGCFYEAPISEKPSREIDKTLLGVWTVSDEPTGKLTVTETDANTYAIEYMSPKEGDKKQEVLKFRGYHTAISGKDLLSLQLTEPQGNQQGKWLFVSYTAAQPDRLEVRTINSKVVPFPRSIEPDSKGGEKLATPEAMEEFFKGVIDKPNLFNPEPIIFLKAK